MQQACDFAKPALQKLLDTDPSILSVVGMSADCSA